MVHQHFMLIPVFTVAENIILGNETIKGLHARSARRRPNASASCRSSTAWKSIPMPWSKTCRSACSSAWRSSRRCIATAKILILDEPTAVLTPQEGEDLFRIMRELAQRGVSIIFISHKLKEVLAVADRITVLRGGRVVGETKPQPDRRERPGHDDGGP